MTFEVMLREREALVRLGMTHGPFWQAIRDGLVVKGVKMSERATRWPASEIDLIIKWRIAGRAPDEIRRLVAELEAKRKQFEPA